MQTWAILLNTLSLVFVCAVIFAFVSVFRHKMKYTTGILCCAGGLTVAMVAALYANNLLTGESYIVVQLNSILSEYKNMVDSLDPSLYATLFAGIEKAELYNMLDLIRQQVLATYPSMMILTFLFVSFVAFGLVRAITRLRGKDVSAYPAFGDLILPRSAAIAFIVTFVVTLFVPEDSVGYFAFANIWNILGGVLMFCGLSFIDFHFRKVLKIGPLRFLIYIGASILLLLVSSLVGMGLLFIGLVDAWFDFRRLRGPKVPPKPNSDGEDEHGQ